LQVTPIGYGLSVFDTAQLKKGDTDDTDGHRFASFFQSVLICVHPCPNILSV
jgi:hypothetical protein